MRRSTRYHLNMHQFNLHCTNPAICAEHHRTSRLTPLRKMRIRVTRTLGLKNPRLNAASAAPQEFEPRVRVEPEAPPAWRKIHVLQLQRRLKRRNFQARLLPVLLQTPTRSESLRRKQLPRVLSRMDLAQPVESLPEVTPLSLVVRTRPNHPRESPTPWRRTWTL
jgi:hypothetical protein